VKYLLATFFSVFQLSTVNCQLSYWQQQVDYKIDVSLNDKEHSLDGYERIHYINNSPDTLKFIWFHIWPNAYKNDRTAFSEDMLKNGSTAFYFSADSMKGYINQMEFKVDDSLAVVEEHPKHADIIKLLLTKPLAPHQSINISTPFHVQLPYNFSRGGHIDQSYQITQWYPKPAVYDSKGWHEMPYLDQGEFYSEFGNYEVSITLPENYLVASTGELQDKDELNKLKTLGKLDPKMQENNKYYYAQTHQLIPGSKTIYKKIKKVSVKSAANLKTLHYKQDNVHDFAWFADKLFLVRYDTVALATKTVDVLSFYHPKVMGNWHSSIDYAKDGLRYYSKAIGDYPYGIATVVAGAANENSGGMEYPTITLITTQGGGIDLDGTITHELGHNWFYGALASNERDHAWMDESINTYYQKRYEAEKYSPTKSIKQNFMSKRMPNDISNIEGLLVNTFAGIKKDQPIDTLSEAYTKINYGLMVYIKGSNWVKLLEQDLTITEFDKAMQAYYSQWKFKHPSPEDFAKTMKQFSLSTPPYPIHKRLHQLTSTGKFGKAVIIKETKFTSFFSLKETDKYNYISVAPIMGLNYYDKLMLGAVIHNYQLPLNRFQFFAAPVYAFGSKQINYAARASYNTYKRRSWLEISGSAAKYSINSFTSDENDFNGSDSKYNMSLLKFVPSIKYTLYNKNPRSTQRWAFQLRNFILTEDKLNFESVGSTGKNIITVVPETSVINQLKITTSDNRILYPYNLNLTIDQGKNFIRAGFTGNYFFNYGKSKGGIDARIFAGKFLYTTSKTSLAAYYTSRYHLNMTGAKGEDDYTYSGYFLGRNEFIGKNGGQEWLSQQIMERDGFFKVRTDLIEHVGKTDDWLMAMNFSGTIPDKINPLQVLPIKIPLKFFVDIGTYADAWKDNASTAKFLYDAGIQLPLLHSLVNVYVPIFCSKVYRDYFKSTLGEKSFLKTISFSIDIQKLQLNKISRDIPL
jgi:hypothetical protein